MAIGQYLPRLRVVLRLIALFFALDGAHDTPRDSERLKAIARLAPPSYLPSGAQWLEWPAIGLADVRAAGAAATTLGWAAGRMRF